MKSVFIGDEDPFFLVLERILRGIGKTEFWEEKEFHINLEKEKESNDLLILLNTTDNTSAQVVKWIWNKIRLCDELLGRKLAGSPILVFGMDRKFTETLEGKVFRDFPSHHQYLTKPLNFTKFIKALNTLSPIDPSSLSVIKGDAPYSVLGALDHDLKSISQKFDYDGTEVEIKKRFREIKVDLNNYEFLENNKKKIQKTRKEVERLRNEIIRQRGNIWE